MPIFHKLLILPLLAGGDIAHAADQAPATAAPSKVQVPAAPVDKGEREGLYEENGMGYAKNLYLENNGASGAFTGRQHDMVNVIASLVAVALDNARDILEITETVLREAIVNAGQWRDDDFLKTAVYGPIGTHGCERCDCLMEAYVPQELARFDVSVTPVSHD